MVGGSSSPVVEEEVRHGRRGGLQLEHSGQLAAEECPSEISQYGPYVGTRGGGGPWGGRHLDREFDAGASERSAVPDADCRASVVDETGGVARVRERRGWAGQPVQARRDGQDRVAGGGAGRVRRGVSEEPGECGETDGEPEGPS